MHPEFEENHDASDRVALELTSIDEVLGAYRPQREQIVIFERGIQWLGRQGFDEEWLHSVVLIHEIAHWMTHMLPKPGIPSWNTEHYVLSSKEVHEGWAQLMTSWVARRVAGEFARTFEDLNAKQAPVYRIFENFKEEPEDGVMSSLEELRLLPRPASVRDWEVAIGR